MFRMTTSIKDIEATCRNMVGIVEECVVAEFTEWAKADDSYLRSNDGFINHTGNLRSSLGAAVIKDTAIEYITPFEEVLGGYMGVAAGKEAVKRLARDCEGKIAKVMVAGMDYAQKVEDIESKDVLESRRIQCEREARSIMERAMQKAERRIKAL